MRRKMATIILAGVMALLLASCGGSLTINRLELSGEEAERYAIEGREDIPAPSEQRYYSCETENPQSYQFYFWRLEDGEWLKSEMGDGAMQEGENILTVYMKGDQDGFSAGVNCYRKRRAEYPLGYRYRTDGGHLSGGASNHFQQRTPGAGGRRGERYGLDPGSIAGKL